MSENIDKDKAKLEEIRAALEREKLEATREWLHLSLQFGNFDAAFNNKMLEVLDIVIAAAKSNPGAIFRSDKSNIDEVINALDKIKRSEGGDVTGGDIVGADWIDDLKRIIEALSGVVKEEKDFFLQIIKLIFCGC